MLFRSILTAESQIIGNAYEEIEVEREGDDVEIAFNAKYLLDVLDVVDCDNIKLELSDPLKPGVLRPVPPAPKEGEARYENDRKIFLATRALKDTPRWSLAQEDNVEEKVLDGYACALGVTPSFERNPKLAATLLRMSRDVRSAVAGPKLKYRRPRPYFSEEGPICIKRSLGLALSPDYPSGHATWGWSVGLRSEEHTSELQSH